MIKKELTAPRLRELFAYDTESGLFTRKTKSHRGTGLPGDNVGILTSNGYIVFRVDGIQYRAHRLAFLYITGDWPRFVVDHIDGVKTNNKWANLRDVEGFINQQNRKSAQKGNSSGVLGASYCSRKKKWRSSIRINGEWLSLGYFDTPELAGAAYVSQKRISHAGCTI